MVTRGRTTQAITIQATHTYRIPTQAITTQAITNQATEFRIVNFTIQATGLQDCIPSQSSEGMFLSFLTECLEKGKFFFIIIIVQGNTKKVSYSVVDKHFEI